MRRGGIGLFVVALAACQPRGGARDPAAATAPSDAKAGAVSVAYRPAATRARTSIELTSSGGGSYVEATATLVIATDVTAQGDALVVAWTIDAVHDLSLQSTATFDETELVEVLRRHGKGAWVIDATGDEDVGATDAHPRNADLRRLLDDERKRVAERRKAGAEARVDPGAALLDLLAPRLAPPRLPNQALQVGQTVERTATSELELVTPAVVLPIESTDRATLLAIDDAGGTRIAELALRSERYGGLDTEDGAVELQTRTEATLWLDLDRGAIVRLESNTTDSFTAADRSSDTTVILRSEAEP